ncbi:hypothetical protein [Paraburkholderia sp. SIMBA_054]|uniref:hypothetical protein n=1 Tax=Paraburkholderia sp. SIMBA_054 TaxID=3085795 RepID=UPI00397A2DA5
MTTSVITLLNVLIETSNDRERGFMKAADQVQHASVNDALLESVELYSRDARIAGSRVEAWWQAGRWRQACRVRCIAAGSV